MHDGEAAGRVTMDAKDMVDTTVSVIRTHLFDEDLLNALRFREHDGHSLQVLLERLGGIPTCAEEDFDCDNVGVLCANAPVGTIAGDLGNGVGICDEHDRRVYPDPKPGRAQHLLHLDGEPCKAESDPRPLGAGAAAPARHRTTVASDDQRQPDRMKAVAASRRPGAGPRYDRRR